MAPPQLKGHSICPRGRSELSTNSQARRGPRCSRILEVTSLPSRGMRLRRQLGGAAEAPNPASLWSLCLVFPLSPKDSRLWDLLSTWKNPNRGFQDCASIQQRVGGKRFLVLSINFFFTLPSPLRALSLGEYCIFFFHGVYSLIRS